jgi:hypothetical protein
VYLRVVGFPGDCSFGMTPSSCPRPGASSISRAIQVVPADRLTVGLPELGRTDEKVTAMDENTGDKWLTRQELADRYALPVKTPAEWASKGTGPRYAKFGRHVRYLLSDVIDWERKQFAQDKRHTA